VHRHAPLQIVIGDRQVTLCPRATIWLFG
jgi:hypothetical protein